ncbi:DNA polymerase III subunit beta [Streptomyces sp. SID3343]|uniref:DNA polymerase III subunit beta n=1 Tax=Streptomyces sp. SID3343 TaxID=2690260 RepID=UPI00136C4866|nr:DNA polymerase III subunit beta [Streptomyces sp. SID3343]
MKIRIERDQLADGIAWAARALPARPAVPVLAGLRLDAAGERLAISAYDYELAADVAVAADVREPGNVLVPGRLLAEISRALPRRQPVEITTDETKARLACAGSYFALPLLPTADYPSTPRIPDLAGAVTAADFAEAVAQVAVAAGQDESVPVLTSIRVHMADGALVLAATDRYRLAVRRLPWHPTAANDVARTALVRAKVLADVVKNLGAGEDVRLALDAAADRRELIGLAGGGRHATSRLLSGQFPKYERLFANETTAVATVETTPLIEALRRVSLVLDRSTPIRLAFRAGSLKIEAGTDDEAEAAESVAATLEGAPISVAFKPSHLLDGLTALRSETTRIVLSTPTTPTVLTDTNNPEDPDYRYLLMPMRVVA